MYEYFYADLLESFLLQPTNRPRHYNDRQCWQEVSNLLGKVRGVQVRQAIIKNSHSRIYFLKKTQCRRTAVRRANAEPAAHQIGGHEFTQAQVVLNQKY